jgi:hypothetical protein
MMAPNEASQARPQAGVQAKPTGTRGDKDLARQVTEAARTVAESASELARETYESSARYVREGQDRYPEAGRYIREGSRAVSRPIERYPLAAVLLFGAFGYAVGYLHGSGWQRHRESVPDYARRRAYSDRSRD